MMRLGIVLYDEEHNLMSAETIIMPFNEKGGKATVRQILIDMAAKGATSYWLLGNNGNGLRSVVEEGEAAIESVVRVVIPWYYG